jgi:hypothetical protein
MPRGSTWNICDYPSACPQSSMYSWKYGGYMWLQLKLADSKWSIVQAQNHQLKVLRWLPKTHFERIRAVCWCNVTATEGRRSNPPRSWSIPATRIEFFTHQIHRSGWILRWIVRKKTSGNFGRASPNLVIICHYHSDTWWHGSRYLQPEGRTSLTSRGEICVSPCKNRRSRLAHRTQKTPQQGGFVSTVAVKFKVPSCKKHWVP